MTLAGFDAAYPDGADYVFVPRIDPFDWLDSTSQAVAQRNRALGMTDLWTVPVSQGVDEIALAFTADAWSRSFRSKAVAVATGEEPIRLRRGLTLIPDATRAITPDDRVVRVPADR